MLKYLDYLYCKFKLIANDGRELVISKDWHKLQQDYLGSVKISAIKLLKSYVADKTNEIEKENNISNNKNNIQRKLTNVGCFRIYIKKYLENNKNINKKMTLMVRQKPLNQYGLPLEIYAFTSNTNWQDYENIQSDIFDHILASTKLFELSVYQSPSSYDLNNFMKELKS